MKYIVFLLLLAAASAFSQQDTAWWEWQNPKPQGSNLNDVAMLDSGTYLAIGDGGTVIRTTDDGATWDIKTFAGARLNAITISLDKQHGIIAAFFDMFLTSDQGVSWVKVTPNLERTVWRDVCYVSNQVLFAVGSKGMLARSGDGGNTWERIPNELDDDFFAVTFADSLHGFIAAENGIFYVTDDGGAHWAREFFPYYNSLFTIDGVEGNIAYAICGGDGGGVFISNDTGTTWKQYYAGASHNVRSTIRLSKDRAIICGDYYKLSVTTDGGASWKHPLTDFRTNHLKALSFADAKYGVCVGTNSIILRTNDGGITWYSAFESIAEQETLRGVFCLDTTTAVAVGSAIVRTTDRGNKWQRIESPTWQIMRVVDFPKPTIGFAAGDSGVVIKSTDAGLTWTKMQTPFASNLIALDFLDADHGFVVGPAGRIAVTSDGGSSWLVTTIAGSCNHTCAAYLSPTLMIVGGCGFQRSTDQGKSWRAIPTSGLNFSVQSISFLDTLHGFAAGYDGGTGTGIIAAAASTSDGGITWSGGTIGPSTSGFYSISAVDKKRATAVGYPGFSAHTADGGKTWFPVETNTRSPIYSVHHPAPQTATAAGFRTLILRLTTTDQPLAVRNPLPSADQLVMSIYPNPAATQTTIRFELTSPDVVTIDLFSVEGKLMKQLYRGLVASGEQLIEADLAELASGAYFIAITSSGGKEYHRIVIER